VSAARDGVTAEIFRLLLSAGHTCLHAKLGHVQTCVYGFQSES